jgi:DNA-directed RNA polymerase subunit RPC12/RpoP
MDSIVPPEGDEVVLVSRTVYVCAQCGKPGIPDPGFTQFDPRYTTGRCSGDHKGPQHLVRDGTTHTPKKRRKKPKEK